MCKDIAFQVNLEDIKTNKRELLDSSITYLGKAGNIIERVHPTEKNPVISDDLVERKENGG